jgi:hypothetical protein
MEPHLKWPSDNTYTCIMWREREVKEVSPHSTGATEKSSVIVLWIACEIDVESLNKPICKAWLSKIYNHSSPHFVMGYSVCTTAVDIASPKNLAEAVTFLEVSDSNMGRYTDYSRDFIQPFHAEVCILPQIKLRQLYRTTILKYSFIVQSFDSVLSNTWFFKILYAYHYWSANHYLAVRGLNKTTKYKTG